jgi:hypothetical protein
MGAHGFKETEGGPEGVMDINGGIPTAFLNVGIGRQMIYSVESAQTEELIQFPSVANVLFVKGEAGTTGMMTDALSGSQTQIIGAYHPMSRP